MKPPPVPSAAPPVLRMRYGFCYPMVVDDDAGYIAQLLQAFRNAGVPTEQIRTFSDGSAAVAALEAAARETRPPLKALPSFVLLDDALPGKSGLEILEWMQQTPSLTDLPVFMLSTSTKPGDMIRALELRARSCFLKPPTFGELEAILEAVLAHWYRRSRGPF